MQTQTTAPALAILPWDWALDDQTADDWTPDWLANAPSAALTAKAGQKPQPQPAAYLPADWND